MAGKTLAALLGVACIAVWTVVVKEGLLLKPSHSASLDAKYEQAVADYGIETASAEEFFSICKHDSEMQKNIKAIWHFVPGNVREAFDKDSSKTILLIANYVLEQYAKHKNEGKPFKFLTTETPYAKNVFKFFRPKDECVVTGFDAEYDNQTQLLKLVLSLDYGDGHLEDSILTIVSSDSTSKKTKAWISAQLQEVASSSEFKQIVLNIVKK